jgi:N-acetylglucosamine-6-sulfatase
MRIRGKTLAAMVLALIAAGLAAVFAIRQIGSSRSACRGCPNVLVIETDDQTVADMAALPQVRESIGAQGVTFTNSFVNYSDCCPSRATFLTGQYAQNHNVLSNVPPDGGFQRLDSDNTLPVWMQRAGYYTAFVGKYLNGYGHPDAKLIPPGWDEWTAGIDAAEKRKTGKGSRSRASYYGVLYNRDGKLGRLAPGVYRTDADAKTARDILRSRAGARQPFFMWLTFLAPHGGQPQEPDDPVSKLSTPALRPRDRDRFRRLPLPTPPDFNERDVSDKPTVIQDEPLSRERIGELRELFQQRRESLLAVDEAVASLVAALREAGTLDNTVIIFTSDNGFMLGEHRLAPEQQHIYEPAIRVPLLMRGPGIPRDQRRSQLVVNADLAPTILALAHGKPGLEMDGQSLLPVLRSPQIPFRREVPIMVGSHFKELEFQGVRTDRYAYAKYDDDEEELYDLRRDPFELTNLANDPAYRRTLVTLRERADKLADCQGDECR